MSKFQATATHKGMGRLRAARHTCSALWLPLLSAAELGTQVTGGCAGSGLQHTTCSRSPRPSPVPAGSPLGPQPPLQQTQGLLTQGLLPGLQVL